jgi:hypothetical protein
VTLQNKKSLQEIAGFFLDAEILGDWIGVAKKKSARRRLFSSDLAEQAGFEPAVGY